MQASLRTILGITVLALGAAALALFAGLADTDTVAQEPVATPVVKPAATPAARPAAKQRRAVDAAWWNQPKQIALLSLTEAQRAKLDALAESYIEEHGGDSTIRDAYVAMGEALADGDWDGARHHSQTAAAAVERRAEDQTTMMIDGVKVLTVEQRQTMNAKFPSMFRRSWVGRGGQRGAVTGR